MSDIDIQALAHLARLNLTDDEAEMIKKDMPSILDYVAKLQDVDVSGVEMKEFFIEKENAFRADELRAEDNDVEKKRIKEEFPASNADLLEVPGIL
jgi:aspartyl-tRNA(Asn)/glutamyl-tRNA(Gln) amidotransferase subunit C